MPEIDREVHALLRRSRGIAQRAQLRLMLSEGTACRLTAFVAEHGEARLLEALRYGHLYDPEMGKSSQRALQHAGDLVEDGLPCTLVIRFDPRNRDKRRRTDACLVTGQEVKLDLDFGRG